MQEERVSERDPKKYREAQLRVLLTTLCPLRAPRRYFRFSIHPKTRAIFFRGAWRSVSNCISYRATPRPFTEAQRERRRIAKRDHYRANRVSTPSVSEKREPVGPTPKEEPTPSEASRENGSAESTSESYGMTGTPRTESNTASTSEPAVLAAEPKEQSMSVSPSWNKESSASLSSIDRSANHLLDLMDSLAEDRKKNKKTPTVADINAMCNCAKNIAGLAKVKIDIFKLRSK